MHFTQSGCGGYSDRVHPQAPAAMHRLAAVFAAAAFAVPAPGWAQSAPPAGEIQGTAVVHTPESRAGVVANANVALPAAIAGGAPWFGKWRDLPQVGGPRIPVVVFLHGSSGLSLKAIEEWQRWLATRGVASVAPDSFALPGRATYKSPVDKDFYERIHALRESEIALALGAVRATAWADPARIVLAGTSEGATAVARYGGDGVAARIIYSWSCEDNYFVAGHRTAALPGQPVLNVISATDPFFSPANGWLGNPAPKGHCGTALAGNPRAVVLLVPDAPHTLINLPAARAATAGFLDTVLVP